MRFYVVEVTDDEHAILASAADPTGLGILQPRARSIFTWGLVHDRALRFDADLFSFHLTPLGERLLAAGPGRQVWLQEATS